MTLVLLVGERRIKMCGLGIGHARWKEGNVISFTWHPWSKCHPSSRPKCFGTKNARTRRPREEVQFYFSLLFRCGRLAGLSLILSSRGQISPV